MATGSVESSSFFAATLAHLARTDAQLLAELWLQGRGTAKVCAAHAAS